MIENLHIKNFKSLVDVNMRLGKITLLSGLNSSGKSSVIQALRMCQNYYTDGEVLLDGHGGIDEMLSGHALRTDRIEVLCDYGESVGYELRVGLEDVVEAGAFLDVIYVGADRLGPRSLLPLKRSLGSYPVLGARGEHVYDFLEHFKGFLVDEKVHHERAQAVSLEYELAGWLGEVAPSSSLSWVVDAKRDMSHGEIEGRRPANVGFGLSYVLPVFAALLCSAARPFSENFAEPWWDDWSARGNNGRLVVLENPEAHLHPQGQTAVGRLLAKVAQSGVQVFVETHSDHVMDGIRLEVRSQRGIDHADVCFHYLSLDRSGVTCIESPRVFPDGRLEFWPEGFFDQTMKNRAKLARRGG